ncbi:MAG TPA: FAD:protein FMN transferase [Burkholderiaceae bacterium]|nr:FAD:protein FMN transferase [Burkholderiaceae bacterium]
MRNAVRQVVDRARGVQPATVSAPATDAGQWFSREEAIMGTAIRVEVWNTDRAAADAAIDAVMEEMHRIDRAMSPFKPDSELSRINREAAHQAVPISAELFSLLARSIEYSELSDGAFDITFAAAGNLYDYRNGQKPDDATLATACAAIGYQDLILDPQRLTVRFARRGMQIDLGGFAKGYAVDNGAAILLSRGITNGIVTAGGDSRIVGDRRGRPWSIGIRHPRRPGEVIAVLPLEDAALSTSGDYERYFEQDGVRCHHVIDPKTGKSPADIHSVSVIAPDGLAAEAFAKIVFVLGVGRGMRLVETQQDVDAVVVDAAGVLHYSSGLLGSNPGAGPLGSASRVAQ